MKVTELNEALIKEITETSRYRIGAIKAYMKKHRYTQKFLAQQLSLEQGTISKMLNENNIDKLSDIYGNLSYQDACRLCEAMDSTLGAVLHEYDQQNAQNSSKYDENGPQEYSVHKMIGNIPEQCNNIPGGAYTVYPSCLFAEGDNLVNNINDPMFLPWFGTYHCYFYSTLSSEDVCFHGVLDIPRTSPNGCCHVRFNFTYGKRADLHKEYYGQLVLSKKQNGGAYCTLVNHDDQGEITYLVMANPAVQNKHVCCILAFAATISGGKGTHHPCVERMIISREPLDGPNFELAKVHLLLNDKHIRITEDSFRAMLESDDLPESFRQRFPDREHLFDVPPLSDYFPRIAVIPEHWVKGLPGYTEQEHQKIIDLMRLYSLAPRYNKIKEKTAENDIYMMYKEAFEKESSHSPD